MTIVDLLATPLRTTYEPPSSGVCVEFIGFAGFV